MLFKRYQASTMVDNVLAVGTFALLDASTSANLDANPCFVPTVEPLVINNRVLAPFEFQPSYLPSLYNMTAVKVPATKYNDSLSGSYFVEGMFISKAPLRIYPLFSIKLSILVLFQTCRVESSYHMHTWHMKQVCQRSTPLIDQKFNKAE